MVHIIASNKHKNVFHIVKLFFKKRLFDFIDFLALTLLTHILYLEPFFANVVTHASNSTLLNIIKFPGKSNWWISQMGLSLSVWSNINQTNGTRCFLRPIFHQSFKDKEAGDLETWRWFWGRLERPPKFQGTTIQDSSKCSDFCFHALSDLVRVGCFNGLDWLQ